MPDLFWPGSERAEGLFDEGALLRAMVRVESAWLDALVDAAITPADAHDNLSGLVGEDDVTAVASGAESSGGPVVPMVDLLRRRLRDRNPRAADWLHRGLTSQDVVDTALMLCAQEVLNRVRSELDAQVETLAALADRHRAAVMAGRTLTQHAVPITFGLKAAQWLSGVLQARDELAGLRPAAQFGGAAGTLAATTELARRARAGDLNEADPARVALDVVEHAAQALGLRSAVPWHTTRAGVTVLGDALVRATDAWGRIANDVLVLTRPEIGELAEPAGRGGSSTMPHKANPVLSVLVRRAALAGPASAAQLHLASACAVDERPDGAWHLEWATLATLCRRTVVAASQTSELLAGLSVDRDRMAATARAAASGLLAERRSLATALDAEPADDTADDADDPAGYLGATDLVLDAVLDRVRSERTARR